MRKFVMSVLAFVVFAPVAYAIAHQAALIVS